ncbi:MAG: histidine phosphatase family protein [Gemmatimonadota bacterium]|nr:histidine phosphatase family protein [Gemmatimonadota bacterium]
MELYIIRHGQSANNAMAEGGRRVCDPPLTAIGEAQADRLACYLATAGEGVEVIHAAGMQQNCAGFGFDRLFSSPMLRAIQTAAPVGKALGSRPEIWIDIHEEGGIWLDEGGGRGEVGYPGLTRSEIEGRFPEFVVPEAVTDEGWWNRSPEVKSEWRARARRVASVIHGQFAGTEERIALVCHGGFANDLLHAVFAGMPDTVYFESPNTAVSRLDFDGEGRVQMRYLARVAHLTPELTT